MVVRAAEKTVQAQPIDTQLELHVQLLKLASLIHRPMREGVAEHVGLGMDEIKIIMCLGGEGPVAGHDITDLMGIPPMNVSRALASLRARGWVETIVDPEDRRRKPVQLSAAGIEANRSLTPDLAEVARYLLGTLSASERTSLGRIVQKIIDRMEGWPADHPEGR